MTENAKEKRAVRVQRIHHLSLRAEPLVKMSNGGDFHHPIKQSYFLQIFAFEFFFLLFFFMGWWDMCDRQSFDCMGTNEWEMHLGGQSSGPSELLPTRTSSKMFERSGYAGLDDFIQGQ